MLWTGAGTTGATVTEIGTVQPDEGISGGGFFGGPGGVVGSVPLSETIFFGATYQMAAENQVVRTP